MILCLSLLIAVSGEAAERITGAREGLWNMQNRTEISFKYGPYALQQILLSNQGLLTSTFRSSATEDGSSPANARMEIFNSASTQEGFSLPQVAELPKKVGLNCQMAFWLSPSVAATRKSAAQTTSEQNAALSRGAATAETGDFIVPSVVNWKVGHYAALVRQEGDRFLPEDPTFGNAVRATRQALEAEASGNLSFTNGIAPEIPQRFLRIRTP